MPKHSTVIHRGYLTIGEFFPFLICVSLSLCLSVSLSISFSLSLSLSLFSLSPPSLSISLSLSQSFSLSLFSLSPPSLSIYLSIYLVFMIGQHSHISCYIHMYVIVWIPCMSLFKNWMTTCLRSCDINAISDAANPGPALHGKFASVTNRVHIAWTQKSR